MDTSIPTLRRTFRILVDVETTVHAAPRETERSTLESLHFHEALVQQLLKRPKLLDSLLRATVIDALKRAEPMLVAEYGWGRVSDQHLLQSVMKELEPAAQAYFSEEIEDGITVTHFDGYETVIKHFQLIELAEPGAVLPSGTSAIK
jgi:hypothetical protein